MWTSHNYHLSLPSPLQSVAYGHSLLLVACSVKKTKEIIMFRCMLQVFIVAMVFKTTNLHHPNRLFSFWNKLQRWNAHFFAGSLVSFKQFIFTMNIFKCLCVDLLYKNFCIIFEITSIIVGRNASASEAGGLGMRGSSQMHEIANPDIPPESGESCWNSVRLSTNLFNLAFNRWPSD